MKYIMFRAKIGSVHIKVPIIFPSTMVHSCMAETFKKVIEHHWPDSCPKVVSAGDYLPASGRCVGNSDTLGVKSHPRDGDIILNYDYFHGVE